MAKQGERSTTASTAQMPACTVPLHERDVKGQLAEHQDEQLLNKASEMLRSVSANILRERAEQPAVPNTTRIFCKMLYGELMSIADVRAREQLQYQLQSVVMRHKYPEMFPPTTPSQYTPLPFTMQPMEPEPVTFHGIHAPAAAAPTRAASAPILHTGFTFPVPPATMSTSDAGDLKTHCWTITQSLKQRLYNIPPMYRVHHADPESPASLIY